MPLALRQLLPSAEGFTSVYTNSITLTVDRRWGARSFEWDEANEDHIARHGVTPAEAEEVFRGRLHVRRSQFGRYFILDRSGAGRYPALAVERYQGGIVRVITAREMAERERQLYLRRK